MRFFRRRWRSGPLLQDATTNFFVLGDVPAADLFGLRLEDLPQGNSYLTATATASADFVIGGLFAQPLTASAVGALTAGGASTAVAVLTGAATGATSIAGEATLATTITLTNPGFETGDTTGWTALTGAGLTILTTTPYAGTYYVAAGQEATSASGQTHDIPSGLLTLADAGLLEMRLAWFASSFGADADTGLPCMEFYDATGGGGTLIGMHSAPRVNYPTIPAWTAYETEAWVPPGTRSVRIQLRSIRVGGAENSSYFDDVSIRFTQRPYPHAQTQFLLGNETTGWTATVGSVGSLVADVAGTWMNASGGAGYEMLNHSTTEFVGYRDAGVPASQSAGVDAGLAQVEMTAQLQSAGTTDTVRLWVEALDASDASLGVVVESDTVPVQASVNTIPVRVIGAVPVGTRTLRYWQQMVPTSGATTISGSRVGIQIEAPVSAATVSATLSASASGAVSGVGAGVVGGALAAAATGAVTAKGSVAAVTFIGSDPANLISPGSPATITLNGHDLEGPGGTTLIQQYDLVVAIIAYGYQSDVAISIKDEETNTEYTVIDTEKYVDGSMFDTNFKVAYFYKTSATAPTRVIVTVPGAESGQAIMWTDLYRGVDPADPIGAVVSATGTGTTRPEIPSIQSTREGSIIAVAAGGAPADGTAWTGSGLLNYRDGKEDSGLVNKVQAARGHAVVTTDVALPATNWGGGQGVGTGYTWAAIAFEINGILPDPGAAVLTGAATSAVAAVGASTAGATLAASAAGALAGVSEAQAEAVLASAATGSLAGAGSVVVQAALAAAGTGAAAIAAVAITSSVLAAAGVGAFGAVGSALAPGVASASASGAFSASSSAVMSGALTSSAVGTASFAGRSTAAAALSATGTGAASLAATAIASGTLTSSAAGEALFGASAFAPAAFSGQASASADYSGSTLTVAVLSGQATADATFLVSSVAEASLAANASGLLSAVGRYAGSTGTSPRFVIVERQLRQIVVTQEDRVIVIEPEQRVVYAEPLPRSAIQ